jgi:hypothetical protein
LIPGLLQTEEYGRALLEHTFGLGAKEVDKVWAVRQHRQELHDREDPPEMLFVVDESALRRDVGRGHVMHRQLERLKEFAAEPHISLQVLTFTCGAHPGMAGNFVLLEFTDPTLDDLVHLESIDEITIRDDTQLIAQYTDRFSQLEELALPTDESNVLLDTLSSEMSPANSMTSAEKEAH